MPRVKGGTVTRNRRKKTLKLAKGYFGSKHRLYRTAKQQVMKSYNYAYRDRRLKKRDFRKLWITRINAAARMHDMSYNQFMYGLKCAGIDVNRKMLSEIAIHDEKAFAELVAVAKKGVEKGNKPFSFGAEPQSETAITITAGKGSKPTTKKETAKPAAKKETASTDLSKMTVAELKELAKEKGIAIPSGSKKADIVALLS